MNDAVISTHDLIKSFGKFNALDKLNLTVNRGEVHGFLGPNGAGKSTTIRVLLGLIKGTSGSAHVFGTNPWNNALELHKRIAYVPGDVTLWPNMTGGETIDFFATLRGGIDNALRDELIDKFDFDPTKKGRQYSKGNRQKVAIIAALASNAELLILDEPTSGLDPLMEALFRDEIARIRAEGRTILLSTHILSEAEMLADRISIIRAGKIVESGTLESMRYHAMTTVNATLTQPLQNPDSVSFLHNVSLNGRHLTGLIDTTTLQQSLKKLSELNVESLTIAPPSLEDLFQRHYGAHDETSPEHEPTHLQGGKHA
ncbi:ABC transporter ATP-binding protein [Timonella sp. A28]|uniref:ABC transporter ATP-binding protein n=1 Tax=Timonella sp. A28 TaxID=3442640 RepID=UPI003EBAD9F7